MVTIREDYRSSVAPSWVTSTVERLLRSVPESHLAGLSSVVLTDVTRRKNARPPRRGRRDVALGNYHPAWQGELAWIELVVPEIVKDVPTPLDKLPLPRDLAFGRVLFHEIGHHLQSTHRGIGQTGESSAEAWEIRLSRMHLKRCYGYMRVFLPLLKLIRRLIPSRA